MNTQPSQPSQKKNFFEKIFKFKKREKNDKPKNLIEGCNNKCSDISICSDISNLEEDQGLQLKVSTNSSTKTLTVSSTSVSSSSETSALTIINEPQPINSTSVTSLSDKGSIKPESTANSWTKSVKYASSFSQFLKHKSSTTSDATTTTNSSVLNSKEVLISSSNGQENRIGSTKKKNKLFNFSRRSDESWSNNNNNKSSSTINSSTIEISNNEQNDSAYETETETESETEMETNNCCCIKKQEKKQEKKKEKKKEKKIRRTKMKTLSSRDKEYTDIKNFFHTGLPNKKILGIIRLQMPTKLVEAHEQFKKEVAQSNNLTETEICHRMFHGTKTAFICKPQNFIGNKCVLFCKIGCGVCGIAQEGNKSKYSRYTQRMWFANNSATSQSYCGSSAVKAMFVVDVVSTSPNSILIIEKDEATIPKYLIIFK